MQRWTLLGLAGAMAFSAWGCGDSEDDTGAGGAGGASNSASSSATGVTTGSMTSTSSTSGVGGGTVCDQACDKLERVCMLGNGYCALNGNLGFANLNNCSGVEAECAAQCVIGDSCMEVGQLFDQLTTDQDVLDCLSACYPSCFGCVLQECDGERHNASQDDNEAGRVYLACLAGCQPNDTSCAADCATNNTGTTTDAVDGCAQTNCDVECFGGQGGQTAN